MSDKYVWEETVDDNKNATMGVAGLIIGGLGLVLKHFIVSSQRANQDKIQNMIDRKTDQYKTLDAKIFKSSAEKEEVSRLKSDIDHLKKKRK